MRTVVFPEPNQVELRDLPLPILSSGQVRIQTCVSSISPGTETLVLKGKLPLIQRGEVTYPLVPGYENCGQVVEVSPGVESLQVGDLVFSEGNATFPGLTSCWGGHSEYVCVPAEQAFRVPQGVSPEEATFTCLTATALHAVRRGQVSVGDSVAIFGQGVIGLLAVQAARLAGADRVIAVDLLDGRLALSSELGATDIVNASRADAIAQINELTAGRGVDVLIEVTGSLQMLSLAPRACCDRGRLVILAMYPAPITFDNWDIYPKELDIFSSRGAGPKEPTTSQGKWTWATSYKHVLNLIAGQRIRVAPLITHRFKIEDIRKGYDTLLDKPNETLKVMLSW